MCCISLSVAAITHRVSPAVTHELGNTTFPKFWTINSWPGLNSEFESGANPSSEHVTIIATQPSRVGDVRWSSLMSLNLLVSNLCNAGLSCNRLTMWVRRVAEERSGKRGIVNSNPETISYSKYSTKPATFLREVRPGFTFRNDTHEIIDGGRSIWDQLPIMVAACYLLPRCRDLQNGN